MACQNADDLLTKIATAGQGPQTVTGDAGSVTMYPVADLIKLHQYLTGICAAGNPRRGLRFTRMVPEGAAGAGGRSRR